MNPLDIVLLVSGVGYVLARRTIGEALRAGPVLAVPLALAALGLVAVSGARPAGPATVALVAAGCGLGAALGLARGATVRLTERDGTPWMRYGAGTLLLWAAGAVLQAGAALLGRAAAPAAAHAAAHGLVLAVGIGVLAETLVALFRASRAGRPGRDPVDHGGPWPRRPGGGTRERDTGHAGHAETTRQG
ncbi:hypothetical protein RVR_9271 [Actinacidiphila reveromycinica]|uniref:DUF1453 domain-containing protein n=1 Tax=Actinacidiphila reveromycinica TaxID=659352 RepID=A0A7U3VSF0_9ACTN|nr:hypothetical protein [Streptomyces sp. SN-593]BBB01729.1 hypothetical protein RVR_9271 [Streptomyces sp. SN-593]